MLTAMRSAVMAAKTLQFRHVKAGRAAKLSAFCREESENGELGTQPPPMLDKWIRDPIP